MIVMNCAAAKSGRAISAMTSLNRAVKVCDVCLMLVVYVPLPSWYISTRLWEWGV